MTDLERSRRRVVLAKVIGLVAVFAVMTVLVIWSPGRAPPRMQADEQVLAGWKAWRSNNCAACHALYGLGGHLGPDLTDVVTRKGTGLIRARTAGGGDGMPAFPSADGDAITAYLDYIDHTGDYPPRSLRAPGYGNFE